MREYGQVQCAYWRDPDIRALSQDAQLLGVYLLTGPHSNGLGCYYLPNGYLLADLKWDEERVLKAFGELSGIDFCKRCTDTEFVLIPAFLRWNEIANANVAKARVKEFETIPKKSSVFRDLCTVCEGLGNHWPDGFKTALQGYIKQEPTRTEPEPTQNQTRSSPAIAGEAKPPVPPCPHGEIIALYHKHLPTAQQVNVGLWKGTRATHLQTRWREDPRRQTLLWWDRFFAYCAESDFLTGKVPPRNGQTQFVLRLDWLVQLSNMTKVIEGTYNRERSAA